MNFLNLKYPILQAPIGSIATVDLVAAVSNAGGMGSLALTWTEPDEAVSRIQALKSITAKLFFVNFVLSFPPRSLDAALDTGVPAVTFSWGQPGRLVEKVHQNGALVGIQVGTVDGAKKALDDGADFIICQGIEAGGHVQSTTPLSDLLQQSCEICESIPVIAAGGLCNGKDLDTAFTNGAKAAMLGTRFIATVESNAHTLYKQALVDSSAEDSIYTLCFDGTWPYAAHRVLRNATLDAWESAGCPQPGQRPNEKQILVTDDSGSIIKRYDDDPPLSKMYGEVLDCCLYAGTGCGNIDNIPNAAKLVSDIWSEYLALQK